MRRASISLRGNASTISRRAQSARQRGVLPGDGNNPRGASGSSQRSSPWSVTSWTSTINSWCPLPEIFIHPSSNADALSVHSLASTSLYTSPSYSTPFATDLYDAHFCLDHVKYYADRFLICFQLEDTQSNRIMTEDEISSTYRRFYQFGAEQVEVAMTETYQFHVDILTANIDEQEAQEAERLCGGAGDVVDNLEIDAVIQEPENNDRNDRYLHREAQRNAAPDDNPGDDSDDDDDDDDWVPGNNNPGGPGGNEDNDNDDEIPAPAKRRRRNGDDPVDGNPPPPGRGAANEDGDNPGDYSNRDIEVPTAFGPNPFVYDDKCQLI